ncbi:MAG: NAD(+)/NADH kinase [Clostridia bacterium]|nr:NAD(+)/NADH kinase [Clostridia bacterium]
MKAGIYFNKNFTDKYIKLSGYISEKLKSRGIDCIVVQSENDFDRIDALIVLGGDGSILTVSAKCAKRGIKIMGINYGHIGFLAEFEQEKLDNAIDLICSKDFKTERRSMLDIEVNGKNYLALNDFVIQRSTCGNKYSNTINLTAEIDGSVVDNYLADGIIVCTPTGSTAYSLAAGGSILTPSINAFALTPLCAHSLHSRPIVYSDSSVLKITFEKNNTAVNIAVDGAVIGEYEDSVTATITKSQYFVEFITSGQIDFFDKLLLKLNKWSR